MNSKTKDNKTLARKVAHDEIKKDGEPDVPITYVFSQPEKVLNGPNEDFYEQLINESL